MAVNTLAAASFDPKRLGISPNEHDADLMGEVIWNKIPNGTAINSYWSQKRLQDMFLANDIPMLPLVPEIDPSLIHKAIFDIGYQGMTPAEYVEATEKLRRPYEVEMDEVKGSLQKSFNGDIAKAITSADGMIHTIYSDDVGYLYKRPYPFQALIPAEANKGKVAAWDVLPPYEFGTSFFGTEDQTFTESGFTDYQRTATVKFMYSVGRVTKAAQFAGLAAIPTRDLMSVQIDATQEALRSLRERSMLGITRTTTSYNNSYVDATSLEYPGVYELIHNNTTSQVYVDGTGVTTYDGIMQKLDDCYNAMVTMGPTPTLAVCDYKTFGVIRRGLTSFFMTDPVQTFVQGVSKISLVFPSEGALPLIPHAFLPQASGSGAIFLLQTPALARRTLWQDTYEELAKINLSQKFVVSACETLIDKTDKNESASLQGGVFNLN